MTAKMKIYMLNKSNIRMVGDLGELRKLRLRGANLWQRNESKEEESPNLGIKEKKRTKDRK